MKKIQLFLILVFALFLNAQNTFASRIKKANKALVVYDYFKAKKHFSKGVKYNTSPATFGLATIYSRNDNPFFNLDSAYRYIIISDSTWALAKDRKKEKWKIYGWTESGIDSLKQIISSQLFSNAKQENTVTRYTHFINRNPWANEFNQAIHSRDSLAFFIAVAKNDANSYINFVEKYPESEYAELAKQNYHNSQFQELTGDGTLESYQKFVENYPESPQRTEADSIIFKMVTAPNTFEAYQDFVLNNSQNTFIKRGWEEFYQVYLFDYSKARMLSFKSNYPQTLNLDEVESDIALFNKQLLPFIKNGFYGLMDENGAVVIEEKYQFIGAFNKGLAEFIVNDQIGLLNKRGEVQISTAYDAVSKITYGRLIVEKNDYFGLIDRKGKTLLECKYMDIGDLSEGAIYLSPDTEYNYVDYNGNQLIVNDYYNASDFNNTLAIVETEEGVGVINKDAEFIIQGYYDNLKWLNDSLLSFKDDNKYGVLSLKEDTLIPAKFDFIGEFYNGLSLVSINDTVSYINESGEFAAAFFETYPNYKSKGDFVNGYAIVAKNGMYGRINSSGDIVTDIEYENLGAGAKFIPFEKEEFWGVLSLTNKVLVSPKYDALDIVNGRFAITKLEDSMGVVNMDGMVLIPNSYKSVQYIVDNSFSVFDGENYGLFVDATLVIPLSYKRISVLNERFVSLMGELSIEYYDLEKKQLVKLQEESE